MCVLRAATSAEGDARVELVLRSIQRHWEHIGRARFPALREDLPDTIQASLSKLLGPSALGALGDVRHFDAWVRSIFVNTALDVLRQLERTRRRAVSPGGPDDDPATLLDRLPALTPGPEDAVQRRQMLETVAQALREVEAARLRYTEDLPEREIAERLGISREAVATRLKRFRQRLRVLLGFGA